MSRFGLSLRCITNLAVLDDEELTSRTVRYMAFLSDMKLNTNLSRAVLMDETAVYLEDPKRQTANLIGAHHAVAKSTSFASMQVTVVLTVSALGNKLTPLVIQKGVNLGANIQKIGMVYIMFREWAWVDSAVLSE